MIRIRIHGRGGHGVKTAGRVAGSAAFLAGLYAQDSPVYGAERRGAAVASYARIDTQPIRERGIIAQPDLVILADETLLDDPASGVLVGVGPETILFVNAEAREHVKLPDNVTPRLVTLDLTRRTLESLGRASALSAGLGAVAVRLAGIIPRPCLIEAVRDELGVLGVSTDDLDRNLQLAGALFDSLLPADIVRGQPLVSQAASESAPDTTPGTTPGPTASRIATIAYEGPVRGAPSVLASGNSVARHTGAWRLERPVIDNSICTRCGLCFVQCPDGAVALDADGYPVIDYDHCKGCLICGHVCPAKAIRTERETQAW